MAHGDNSSSTFDLHIIALNYGTIWAIIQSSCPKKQMHNNPTTSAALQPTSETALICGKVLSFCHKRKWVRPLGLNLREKNMSPFALAFWFFGTDSKVEMHLLTPWHGFWIRAKSNSDEDEGGRSPSCAEITAE
ncbi:Uncharacterized protein Fot_49194 [Forsythia ovata]|uniref:Uncharacterized protein n=1 Tax=Forsythia ovata TaxID=205694 RepID=A0ABD1QB91_9LAMI